MTHPPGTWYLSPLNSPKDEYAAGYDSNVFDSREDAVDAIPGLAEALDDGTVWVARMRPLSKQQIEDLQLKMQAYLAALEAVGKEHGFSLGHEDGQGAFLVFRGGGGDWFTGARLELEA
jgi:hypothetical protein